jgi:hypothetical protein
MRTIEIQVPDKLSFHATLLLTGFAESMAEKLEAKAAERAEEELDVDGWRDTKWAADEAVDALLEHVKKGDPVDVANLCAFLWHHHLSTSKEVNAKLEATNKPKHASKKVEDKK